MVVYRDFSIRKYMYKVIKLVYVLFIYFVLQLMIIVGVFVGEFLNFVDNDMIIEMNFIFKNCFLLNSLGIF